MVGEQIKQPHQLTSSQKKTGRNIAVQLQKNSSIQSRLELAKLTLAAGDTSRAIAMFRYALEKRPWSARIYNDQAVAYLSRHGNFIDSAIALDLLSQALKRDAGLLEARFNKALALEKLYLPREALKAWEVYLRDDPNSAWSLVARRHMLNLRDLLISRWEGKRYLAALLAESDKLRFNEAAARFGQEARTYGEEDLLSDWAINLSNGKKGDAGRALGIARNLGEALASCSGERMLSDSVAVIDQVVLNKGSGKLGTLLKGHSLFKTGLNLYYGRDADRALPIFEQSAIELRKGGSPFQYWASFFSFLCKYYIPGSRDVLAGLNALRSDFDARRYASLAARIDWIVGLLAYEGGNYKVAMASLGSARERFKQARENENMETVSNLMANCLDQMGEHQNAWSTRSLVLEHAEGFTSAQRLHNIYGQTAAALTHIGYWRVAQAFQNEVMDIVTTAKDPLLGPIGRLQRAQILAGLGRSDLAFKDLETASVLLDRVPSSSQRAGVAADIALAESRALAHEPKRAIDLVTTVIDNYRKTNYRFRLVDLFHQRANLYQDSCGVAAEADRAAALEELAAQGKHMVNILERSLQVESGMIVYDEQIGCLARKHDYVSALVYSEKSRAVWSLNANGAKKTAFDLQAMRASIPLGVLVIEYSLAGDKLIAWGLSRDHFSGKTIALNGRLGDDVDKFSAQLAAGTWPDRLSVSIFETLLAPFREDMAAASRVVLIPDKFLWTVPFSALTDKASGKCLLESHEVVISPSLAWYVTKRKSHSPRKFTSVFAIGSSTLNRLVFPDMEGLPEADRELKEIKHAYSSAVVKVGSDATKEQFLRGLKEADLVYFAGHALDNRESPWLSALLFTPDPGNGDSVGIAYARDLYGQHIRSRAVILSACSTAGSGNRGFRTVSGWVQAFLEAGAENVIVTYWPMSDNGSQGVLTSFHEAMQKRGRVSGAFRAVQRSLCGRRCSSSSARDWGGFGVFGI